MPLDSMGRMETGAGIGWRSRHHAELLERRPPLGFLEVHAENHMGGGRRRAVLEQARRDYPVSIHGVGLSLGGAEPVDEAHLERFAELVDVIDPILVSEHVAWCRQDGVYLNDLLPLPYTDEALDVVCDHVDEVQEHLHRQILIENISSYVQFRHSTIPEAEFIADVARRTGCGILLDVNNLYVNEANNGIDPDTYLDALPVDAIGEIHLAGHDRVGALLIDTHGTRVAPAVWELYARALHRFGLVPTLIEWDTDIPPLDVLLEESSHAAMIMRARHAIAS